MNKNALTEKRRETVIGLLKGMNIKKSDGEGFDKEDVYGCMQRLCDLYEQNIEELENAYETELTALKDKYQKYDDNNELYVSLIMEAKKSSNDIINQAKNEVENILNEGKQQVAKQEKEIEKMRIDMVEEQKQLTEHVEATREATKAEEAAMIAELEAEKQKVSAMKSKYTQQLNAMEEEFEEIKTNILRTAGKIDSLKSKLPHEDEVSWDVSNSIDTVNFPVQEIEFEHTIGVAETDVSVENHVDSIAVEPDAVVEVAPVEEEDSLEDMVASSADFDEDYDAGASEQDDVRLEDLVAPDKEEEFGFVNHSEIQEDHMPDNSEENGSLTLEDLTVGTGNVSKPTQEISFEGLEELFRDEEEY